MSMRSPNSRIVPNRRNRSWCERMKRAHCGRCGIGACRESNVELLDLRLQDLTSQEIAVAMKRSQTAVRNVQYRMIKKLRDCLGIRATQGEETHVVA